MAKVLVGSECDEAMGAPLQRRCTMEVLLAVEGPRMDSSSCSNGGNITYDVKSIVVWLWVSTSSACWMDGGPDVGSAL